MKIGNIKILGGNQQFADKIYNNTSQFSEVDEKLINLIQSEISSEEEREILLKDLEEIKENGNNNEPSKSRLSSFLENLTTESGKQVAKELIASGSELISNIIS